MAHPSTTEASTAPASMGEKIEDFADYLGLDEEQEEQNPEGEEPEGEAEEDTPEPDTDEEEGEPDEPAIAAPVSWDKDAKEQFAQLPREVQKTLAEREAQRDKLVQQRTTEAAEAKRNAAVEANAMFAEERRQHASYLEQVAAMIAPQRPDPALLGQDPQAFYQLQAQYEQATAQQQHMVQRAAQARAEAEQRDGYNRQAELAKDNQVLGERLGDDWTDMSRRKELLTGLEGVGAELGYPADLMGQANATDILALHVAAGWKAKADKYDALQKTKMAAVRDAKNLPKVVKPGVPASKAERSARSADAAWQRVKSGDRSGDAQAAFLESIGISL